MVFGRENVIERYVWGKEKVKEVGFGEEGMLIVFSRIFFCLV